MADILLKLAHAAPALDCGDLIPERVRPPRPSRVQQTGGLSLARGQEAASSITTPPSNGTVQKLGAPQPARHLKTAIQAQPSTASMEKAHALAARGQLHKAFRVVDDVLRLAPDHAEARLLRERLRLLEQREKNRRREPRNPRAQLEAGFSYLQLEANRDATDALQKACQLSPDLYLAHLLRGIALHRLGEVREARSAYFRAARLRPGDDIHDDLLSALERGEPPMPLVEGEISAPAGLTLNRYPRLALAG